MATHLNELWKLIAIIPPDEEEISKFFEDNPEYGSKLYGYEVINIIHLAVKRSISVKIIRKLLDFHPECCMYRNPRKCLLLHDILLSDNKIPNDVFCEVLSRNTNAINVSDIDNNLPLHIECSHHCRLDFIIKLLDIDSEIIKPITINNRLLQLVLTNLNSMLDSVMFIINRYPHAVRMNVHVMTGGHHLPLHIECRGKCRYEVISKLLDIYPEAISIVDEHGKLPLLCSLDNAHTQHDAIIYLINRYPDAVSIPIEENEDDYVIAGSMAFPLHMECIGHCRYSIIAKLIDVYPDAISIRNNCGNLPLHLVIISQQHVSGMIIRFLLGAYPAAASIYNHNMSLPLYLMFYKYWLNVVTNASDSRKCVSEYKAIVIELINHYPQALYLPVSRPYINTPFIHDDRMRYRLLLNLSSHHLASQHIHDYHDMNYQPRSLLMRLIYQLSLYDSAIIKSLAVCIPSHQQLMQNIKLGVDVPLNKSNTMVVLLCHLLIDMLASAGIQGDRVNLRYGWMIGDDLGCMLLRTIVLYL